MGAGRKCAGASASARRARTPRAAPAPPCSQTSARNTCSTCVRRRPGGLARPHRLSGWCSARRLVVMPVNRPGAVSRSGAWGGDEPAERTPARLHAPTGRPQRASGATAAAGCRAGVRVRAVGTPMHGLLFPALVLAAVGLATHAAPSRPQATGERNCGFVGAWSARVLGGQPSAGRGGQVCARIARGCRGPCSPASRGACLACQLSSRHARSSRSRRSGALRRSPAPTLTSTAPTPRPTTSRPRTPRATRTATTAARATRHPRASLPKTRGRRRRLWLWVLGRCAESRRNTRCVMCSR